MPDSRVPREEPKHSSTHLTLPDPDPSRTYRAPDVSFPDVWTDLCSHFSVAATLRPGVATQSSFFSYLILSCLVALSVSSSHILALLACLIQTMASRKIDSFSSRHVLHKRFPFFHINAADICTRRVGPNWSLNPVLARGPSYRTNQFETFSQSGLPSNPRVYSPNPQALLKVPTLTDIPFDQNI